MFVVHSDPKTKQNVRSGKADDDDGGGQFVIADGATTSPRRPGSHHISSRDHLRKKTYVCIIETKPSVRHHMERILEKVPIRVNLAIHSILRIVGITTTCYLLCL